MKRFRFKKEITIYLLLLLWPFLFNGQSPPSQVSQKKGREQNISQKNSSPKRLGYHHYTYSLSFGGSGLGEGSFDRPVAICVDSQNNIYVLDQGNNLVQKFDKNGEFLYQWGKSGIKEGEFDSPSAIAVDKEDNIYVVDTINNRIQKFDFSPDNNSTTIEINHQKVVGVTVFGSMGSGSGRFQSPIDIVIDDDNYVYVLDAGNHRIQKFNSKGEFIAEWGSYGSGRECFLAPLKLAYDPTGFGYLYVLDRQRQGLILHKINNNGHFLGTLNSFKSPQHPEITKPSDFYIDPDGFIYLLDQGSGSVYKFSTDGDFIQRIEELKKDKSSPLLKKPKAIVQDSDKRLLIIDSEDNLIKVFDEI